LRTLASPFILSLRVMAAADSSSITTRDRDAPGEPEVSGVLVRALAETVMRYEIEPAALVDGESDVLNARVPLDVRVPLQVFGRMLKRAADLTGEPCVGLLCGVDASDSAFDLFAPLVSHVATLRHAIQETSQFEALLFNGAHMYLTEAGDVARLRCEFPRSQDSTDRSIAEFMVGGLTRLLQRFGATRRDLHAAYFEHRRPIPAHAYAKIFRGGERFSEPFTGLEFSSRLLDRPHLHANPELQSAVHVQAEQRLERLARPDLVDRLRAYLVNHPTPGRTGLPKVAQEFGVSVRSLRRRLMETGNSYRALTQEMQRQRACMLLGNPTITVKAVAGSLGYDDTSAFRRAFRRWTGLSIWEYRRSLPSFSTAERPVDDRDGSRGPRLLIQSR
jgi:AraC-like DNA-binding protein